MKKAIFMLLILLCMLGLSACSGQEVDESRLFDVYYISNSETRVESHFYVIQSQTQEEQLGELLDRLAATPEKLEYKAPLALGYTLLDYELEDGKVTLDVSGDYKKLPPTTEVLVRAAIVSTLTQIQGVNLVGITVEGSPLTDNLENVVGLMAADHFINNAGNEINTYQKVKLKLYFANEKGDALVPVTQDQYYNTNISLERLVVEALIKGPEEKGTYPTANPETKVISAVTKDGTCYVSLSDTFLTQIYNVTADVAIFSIVNSLVELSNVNKVQISINGDTTGVFREKHSFSTIFERNLDIVTASGQ